VLNKEVNRLENGGMGTPGEKLITPAGAAQPPGPGETPPPMPPATPEPSVKEPAPVEMK
jgi:hypothetical protein